MIAGAAERVATVGAMLGEGPVWIDGALWFVDIKAPCIYRLRGDHAGLDRWDAPTAIGWVVPFAGGGLLAGLKTGIHRFDPASGAFSGRIPVEPHLMDNRLNDAVVGADGTLWFGSMDDTERDATGRFYRLSGGRVIDCGLPPAVVTNGPALSPDGRTLYATDTLAGVIAAVSVNDDNSLGAPRRFATFDTAAEGFPDGPSVDVEGCVWTGLWGGASARRYDPAGRLMEIVRLPVTAITKVAFGGPDLTTAYVTTARIGLHGEALAAQPLAGDLFAFEAGVAGLRTPAATG